MQQTDGLAYYEEELIVKKKSFMVMILVQGQVCGNGGKFDRNYGKIKEQMINGEGKGRSGRAFTKPLTIVLLSKL